MAIYQILAIAPESSWYYIPELIGAIVQSIPEQSFTHYWADEPKCGITDFEVLNSGDNNRFSTTDGSPYFISIFGVTLKKLFR